MKAIRYVLLRVKLPQPRFQSPIGNARHQRCEGHHRKCPAIPKWSCAVAGVLLNQKRQKEKRQKKYAECMAEHGHQGDSVRKISEFLSPPKIGAVIGQKEGDGEELKCRIHPAKSAELNLPG